MTSSFEVPLTRREAVTQRLRHEITSGVLSPGTVLKEAELAARLGDNMVVFARSRRWTAELFGFAVPMPLSSRSSTSSPNVATARGTEASTSRAPLAARSAVPEGSAP